MTIEALICRADGTQVFETREAMPDAVPAPEPTADELLKILAGVTE